MSGLSSASASSPRQRNPNIHDVAKAAGVSHQTVSRVLNGYAGIRPATRERVIDAIARLGYRRNLAARTLVTGRSHSIGVLMPEEPNFGPMSSLRAVERAAREAGFFTLVTSTTPDTDRVAAALDYALGKSIDALVLMAQRRSVVDTVSASVVGLPTVSLLTGGVGDDWSIAVDQERGIHAAGDHLTALGHRHIQHLAGPMEFTEAQLRHDAFVDYRDGAGLPALPTLSGDWSADSGYAAGMKVAAEATAVVCANDQMAMGLIHALADQGRAVPQDVSVVGFDDLPEARHSLPPLTTIHQDFDAVGELAVQVLLARLAKTPVPVHAPVVPWLVERGSTAPPR